jgi:hypothetical protein
MLVGTNKIYEKISEIFSEVWKISWEEKKYHLKIGCEAEPQAQGQSSIAFSLLQKFQLLN